jgi:N,N'-diacetylchitobiose phosphorylase
VHVLRNDDRYAVHLTDSGAGVSMFGPIALTRWAPDRTRSTGGVFFYLRDLDSDVHWSATEEPAGHPARQSGVIVGTECISFAREDDEIHTTLDVTVTPGLDAELRMLTLENASDRVRRFEVTTYLELVLDRPEAFAAHPAFSRLFVQTEWDAEHRALLAHRRPRSAEDESPWLVHLLHTDALGPPGAISWETDRMRFLGRGRTPARPRAMDAGAALSGTTGNVLDPVFSLRRTIELAPRGAARLVAVLGAGKRREDVDGIAAHFHAFGAACDAVLDAKGKGAGATMLMTEPRHQIRSPFRAAAAPGVPVPADAGEPLRFFNGLGGFSDDGSEYVLRLDATPHGPRWPALPWSNVIANEHAGFLVTESGAGYTWSVNSRENRLTPWSNDPVSDPHGEALYLRDEDAGVFWSPLPGPAPAAAPYEVRHGFGYSTWRHTSHELEQEVAFFMSRHDPVKLSRLRVRNVSDRPRRISVTSYAHLVLGTSPWDSAPSITTTIDEQSGATLATNTARREFAGLVAFAAAVQDSPGAILSATCNRSAFLGPMGSVADPDALHAPGALDGRSGTGLDPCAALRLSLTLAPGEIAEATFLLGEATSVDAARAIVGRYRDRTSVAAALEETREFWRDTLSGVRIETPAPALDVMVNGWLAYQNLSCRLWGRSAFYQAGGAFGFRDQLQDASGLLYLSPSITRAQIVLHASHQFVEGDVLHWWHPPTSRGIRSRFSDDRLWLPYVAAFYVASTGDRSVLDAITPFLTGSQLAPGEDERALEPADAGTSASVYEHCCLAIDRSLTTGRHGLPLMGSGDWNDGMNRVGGGGSGESVWLGFFLFDVLDDFIPICESRGDSTRAERYRAYQTRLGAALNDAGWDGAWYRRAYYDDGTPLGSSESDECRIDTIAQAWAVLSGVASPTRAEQALDAMEQQLVSEPEQLIRLLTPPFDATPHDPGYIKGYLPGVRENGAQYTHAALWAVRALAEHGRAERAARLLEMLSPARHGGSPEAASVYKTEPYVIAADVYGAAPHVGRGGWTWYTGSAGWMFRVAIESILGMTLQDGDRIELRPCIPAAWPGFKLHYRLPDRQTQYEIDVKRGAKATESTTARVDGEPATIARNAVILPLHADGGIHRVEITLGADVGPRYVPRYSAAPFVRMTSE